jgi:hypothetical protein
MDIEQKVKTKLLIRGFSNENLLNNRGLIGATTDETILEIVKNLGIANVRRSSFHKPKKQHYTSIIEFEVVKPQHELETEGERLKLSMFGEYCPDASLRGYELEELLTKPQHYRPKVIVQMGETVSLNYA